MIPAALLACALHVAPATLEAAIRVESGGDIYSLNVNHLVGPQPRPASLAEAVGLAEEFIHRGYSVDIGLMQVNSRNLPSLGLTIEQAFEPCTNIRAGATILTANYVRAAQQIGPGQPALLAALSAYNTGDFARGFTNGYVARYLAGATIPAISGVSNATHSVVRRPPPNPYAADTQVVWSNELVALNR